MPASYLRRFALRAPTVVALVVALLVGVGLATVPAHAAGTGHITGTVTSTGGAHPAGVLVTVWTPTSTGAWTQVTTTTTASDGSYDAGGLDAGTYELQYSDPSGYYLAEYWRDQPSLTTATDVVVAAGATVGGISPVLTQGGRIRGVVTGPTGTGLSSIQVVGEISTQYGGWSPAAIVSTATDGSYVLGGLAAGTYRLSFQDSAGHYAHAFNDGAPTIDGASDITVTAGSDTPGENARLAVAAHVVGTVTGPGGTPAGGVLVSAIRYDGTNAGFQGSAYTDSSGHYDLGGLNAGDYRIEFSDYQNRYFSEYWDNQTTLSAAADLVLDVGTVRSGIDAELTSGRYISGRVTGVGNVSLGRVYAMVYQPNVGTVTYAYVKSDGTYRVGPLQPGTYTVGFLDDGGNYAPAYWDHKSTWQSGTPIVVSDAGDVSGIDAQLKLASHVTGQLTDTEANPLGGVFVTAYPYGSKASAADVLGYATTTPTGDYDVGGLPAGTYRLSFNDTTGGHIGEYWDDKPSLETANDIKVAAGKTAGGKNAQLADAAQISGVVTGADGAPVIGAYVSAQVDSEAGGFGAGGSTQTDGHGAYTIKGLRSGNWVLSVSARSGRYLDQYYSGKPTFETADRIPVAPGESVTGKNMTLALASHLTGTVTGPTGQPVSGAYVSALAYNQQDQDWESVSYGTTDSAGAYDVGHLTPDTYRLEFGATGYGVQFWKNEPTLDRADGIKVGAHKVVSGKDARLQPEGRITGTVTDRQGVPVPYLNVQAYTRDAASGGWDYFTGTVSDAAGNYTLSGLTANTYRVGFLPFEDQRFATQYWNAKPDVFSADDVAVAAGSTVAGTSARLDPQATISGLLTDSSGHGVGVGVDVFRKAPDGTFVEFTHAYSSYATGAYTVTQLPPGTYRLRFDPYGQGGLAPEYYDNATTLASATDVVVAKVGQKIRGKDAVLGPATAAHAQVGSTAPMPATTALRPPTVTGLPLVGSTLVAGLGPRGGRGESLSYQWQVGGVDVPGATGSTYTLGPQDLGQPVSVRVTSTAPGRAPTTATSVPSPAVQPARGVSAGYVDQHDGLVAPQPPALQAAGLRP